MSIKQVAPRVSNIREPPMLKSSFTYVDIINSKMYFLGPQKSLGWFKVGKGARNFRPKIHLKKENPTIFLIILI